MNEIPKSCTTCQHRIGKGIFAKCADSGFYISVNRQFPSVVDCDVNYSRWVKRLSIKERFLFWLKGEIK